MPERPHYDYTTIPHNPGGDVQRKLLQDLDDWGRIPGGN